jgi:hypothetical protein
MVLPLFWHLDSSFSLDCDHALDRDHDHDLFLSYRSIPFHPQHAESCHKLLLHLVAVGVASLR